MGAACLKDVGDIVGPVAEPVVEPVAVPAAEPTAFVVVNYTEFPVRLWFTYREVQLVMTLIPVLAYRFEVGTCLDYAVQGWYHITFPPQHRADASFHPSEDKTSFIACIDPQIIIQSTHHGGAPRFEE
jgi:hypothetical protein